MDPIRPGFFDRVNFFGESGKVRGENGRSDQAAHRRKG
jgi:hypothetical protein